MIGDGTIRNKDNGRPWITDRFPPVQPGGKNFSIDVTVLLKSGGRMKAMYDYRTKQWKSAMENMSEEKKKMTEEDKEQVKYLEEWAAKHPKDNKQGWVAHLFQRFLRRE